MNITTILHALFRFHSHHHDHSSSTINTTITSIRLRMIVTITSHSSSVPSWNTSNVTSTITSLVLLNYHSQNSTPLSHFRARFHITTMVCTIATITDPANTTITVQTPPSLSSPPPDFCASYYDHYLPNLIPPESYLQTTVYSSNIHRDTISTTHQRVLLLSVLLFHYPLLPKSYT